MRRGLAAAAIVATLAAGVVAACTTFDGVVAGTLDASVVADAGVDVVADAPPALPTYLSAADAARVCSTVFKCQSLASSIVASIAVPIDPTNYSLCMDWLAGPVPSNRVGVAIQAGVFMCIAAATTCRAAGECLPIENFAPGDPRCTAGGADAGEKCADDGGTVLRCADQYALHCGSAYYAPGSRCMQGVDKSHWCALNANCTTASSCVGSLLDYCGSPSNLHEGINCAASGYACGIDPEAGSPDCLTATRVEKCAAVGTDCAAESVAVCDGYEISKFDCSALGGTCSKKGGPARCVRANDACTPLDGTMNACAGSKISLCVGGASTSFDCATIGATCKPGVGALSGHCG